MNRIVKLRNCVDWTLVRRYWRHWYQWLTRGFSDQETWALDYEIAKFTLPRLKRYKEIASDVIIIDWDIDKAIAGLEEFVKKEGPDPLLLSKESQEGLELFRENLWRLWW